MIPKSMHDLAVEAARIFGRQEAESEAVAMLGRIVAAAGGEVRVPDRLFVGDVFMDTDYLAGETIFRTRPPVQEAKGER